WLSRIHAAASSGNYQGTMVFSAGGTLSSSRVWHYCVGDQTYERLEMLDGRQQRIVRHNDAVHTLWPQKRLAVVEKRETLAAWSTTPQTVDPKALDQYELRPDGSARVAGREATVFMLEPRDTLRYAQRLWADQASGLMLRADVIGPGADRPVLESTAFSEIQIGVKPQPEAVLQAIRNIDDYRVVRPQQKRTTLEAEGWTLARPVAGFSLAGCLQRGMENAGESEPVLQAVFTDGLTHVSVFLESYKPQRHRTEMQARQGATATVMLRRGEHWVTAVGDVPPATLELFAEAIERRR
ncbi:MAG: MucB/RseB C-terminal domain-containing protein, partial [Rubrivivax sp.]|nr:MucB/RseB C-terminal domain-containing protein [Rubrivivax sp.]